MTQKCVEHINLIKHLILGNDIFSEIEKQRSSVLNDIPVKHLIWLWLSLKYKDWKTMSTLETVINVLDPITYSIFYILSQFMLEAANWNLCRQNCFNMHQVNWIEDVGEICWQVKWFYTTVESLVLTGLKICAPFQKKG